MGRFSDGRDGRQRAASDGRRRGPLTAGILAMALAQSGYPAISGPAGSAVHRAAGGLVRTTATDYVEGDPWLGTSPTGDVTLAVLVTLGELTGQDEMAIGPPDAASPGIELGRNAGGVPWAGFYNGAGGYYARSTSATADWKPGARFWLFGVRSGTAGELYFYEDGNGAVGGSRTGFTTVAVGGGAHRLGLSGATVYGARVPFGGVVHRVLAIPRGLSQAECQAIANGQAVEDILSDTDLVAEHDAAAPLYIRYNGGEELHDSVGHLPRDADGFYLSRTTGLRLTLDEGYVEGDRVGPQKVGGLVSAEVVGDVDAGGRGAGFYFNGSDANHVVAATEGPSLTLFAHSSQIGGNYDAIVAMATAASPATPAFSFSARGSSARMIVSNGTHSTEVRCSAVLSGACYLGGSYDYATGQVVAWQAEDGGLANEETATGSVPAATIALAGPIYMMRAFAAGYPWTRTVHLAIGWAMVSKPDSLFRQLGAAIDAGATRTDLRDGTTDAGIVAAAVAQGATAAEVHAGLAHDATFISDGPVCGGTDAAAPNDLFFIGAGTGAPVWVSRGPAA